MLGSGNLVHNLRHAFTASHRGETATPAWARAFDEGIAAALRFPLTGFDLASLSMRSVIFG